MNGVSIRRQPTELFPQACGRDSATGSRLRMIELPQQHGGPTENRGEVHEARFRSRSGRR